MVDAGTLEREEQVSIKEYKEFILQRNVKYSKYKANRASEIGKMKVTGRVIYEHQ